MNNNNELNAAMLIQINKIKQLLEKPDSFQEEPAWKRIFSFMIETALRIYRKDILDQVMELAEICYCIREDFSMDMLAEVRSQYSDIYKKYLQKDILKDWEYIEKLCLLKEIKKKKSLCILEQVYEIIYDSGNDEYDQAERVLPLWKDLLSFISPCVGRRLLEDIIIIFIRTDKRDAILDYIDFANKHKSYRPIMHTVEVKLCIKWCSMAHEMNPLQGLFLLCKIVSGTKMLIWRRNVIRYVLKVLQWYIKMPEEWFDGDPEKTLEKWLRSN